MNGRGRHAAQERFDSAVEIKVVIDGLNRFRVRHTVGKPQCAEPAGFDNVRRHQRVRDICLEGFSRGRSRNGHRLRA
jgi:hypothetical protein